MLDSKKYQKHVVCSYGYKLVFVDDKFGKPFKSQWDKDTSYNFIMRLKKVYIETCHHLGSMNSEKNKLSFKARLASHTSTVS